MMVTWNANALQRPNQRRPFLEWSVLCEVMVILPEDQRRGTSIGLRNIGIDGEIDLIHACLGGGIIGRRLDGGALDRCSAGPKGSYGGHEAHDANLYP